MKSELNNILMAHYKKYPKMEVEDYLKLLYQACYGPSHFQNNPSKDKIKMRINEELVLLKSSYTLIENIGNNYVRVHLGLIKNQQISTEGVVEAFYQSMNEDKDLIKAEEMFLNSINQLKEFLFNIQEEKIANESIHKIDEYLQNGIKPIHHSKTFRDNYFPHYRVISKKYLKAK